MNKNLEIQKIKVNNGQGLITEARKYKNSGGEWKLRERYMEMAAGGIGTRKNKLGWGIVISNGEQTIDIFSPENNIDYEDLVKKDLVLLDECNARPELYQLFPEYKFALFDSGNERINTSTYKKLKKDNEGYRLYTYLVAENFRHLELIISEYFGENEAKIYNSANRNFSDWVEIIDGQDGNMYLYVGEKNSNGGREIKIGIQKNEFNKKEKNRLKDNEGNYYSGSELLETTWGLLLVTTDQPQTPVEKENYYRSFEELFKKQWPHREKLCRNYWERILEEMIEGGNYWKEKVKRVEYSDDKANHEHNLVWAMVSSIGQELKENSNIKICSDECHHLHSNLPKKDNPTPFSPTSPKTNGAGKTPNNKNNQLKDSEKSQILSYFIAKKISKISLENGKLVIEYSKGNKEIIKNESQELQKYHQFIQTLPNQSLSLSDLQNNTNNLSNPNKSNLAIYISLALGAFILGGVFVYFLARKKKNK